MDLSGRVRKTSAYTGIRCPDHPTRSESLCRLSYPGTCEVGSHSLSKIHTNTSKKNVTCKDCDCNTYGSMVAYSLEYNNRFLWQSPSPDAHRHNYKNYSLSRDRITTENLVYKPIIHACKPPWRSNIFLSTQKKNYQTCRYEVNLNDSSRC